MNENIRSTRSKRQLSQSNNGSLSGEESVAATTPITATISVPKRLRRTTNELPPPTPPPPPPPPPPNPIEPLKSHIKQKRLSTPTEINNMAEIVKQERGEKGRKTRRSSSSVSIDTDLTLRQETQLPSSLVTETTPAQVSSMETESNMNLSTRTSMRRRKVSSKFRDTTYSLDTSSSSGNVNNNNNNNNNNNKIVANDSIKSVTSSNITDQTLSTNDTLNHLTHNEDTDVDVENSMNDATFKKDTDKEKLKKEEETVNLNKSDASSPTKSVTKSNKKIQAKKKLGEKDEEEKKDDKNTNNSNNNTIPIKNSESVTTPQKSNSTEIVNSKKKSPEKPTKLKEKTPQRETPNVQMTATLSVPSPHSAVSSASSISQM